MGRLADLFLHPFTTEGPTSEESGQHHVLLQVGSSSCSSSSTSRPGAHGAHVSLSTSITAHAHVSRSTSITSFFEDNSYFSSKPSNSGAVLLDRRRATTIKPPRRTLFADGAEEENKNGDEQQASDEAEKDQEKSAEENAEGSADSEKQATTPDPKPTEQEDDPADASGGLPTKPGSGDAAAFDAATGNVVDKGRSNLANNNPTENEDAGTDGGSDQKSVQVVRAERLEKLIDQAKDTLAQLFSGTSSGGSGGSAASSGGGDPNDEPGQPSLSEEDVKMIQCKANEMDKVATGELAEAEQSVDTAMQAVTNKMEKLRTLLSH
ncbi:unnamed protein product [Amoebophrya sp. A120]|nr:unnamed protein product [Amoebophrya sp. A120]|eukprot:GSA120T00011252001.1